MVSDDAAGGQVLPDFRTLQGTGSGVIHLGPAVKPFLEGLGIFADVVGQPQKPSPFFFPEFRGEAAAKRSGFPQMGFHGLLPTVLGNMRQIHNKIAASFLVSYHFRIP